MHHYTCGPYHNQCQPNIMPGQGKNYFRKEDYFNKMSIEWLDYVVYSDEQDIKHAHDHGEQRTCRRQF